ncbi:MAG: Hsp20/alpha crystallin family protein [Desulfobacteraceae bacterium]|nr:Hsp20/alpha crystallin family protein [Desulfobacteraceae bacterium]MCF8094137.1 Hsp20/alpha crystallin family protein [Desulfobacteraceae bacterium]
MANETQSRDMQVKGRQDVAGAAEQTKPGPVFTPAVDICEDQNAIKLMADMPGVQPDDVNIDVRDNTLTLTGEIQPFENSEETDLMIEYEVGQYYRQFTLPELIDQEKIDAQLKDGVLNLVLPKAEAAKPKKIEIKSG